LVNSKARSNYEVFGSNLELAFRVICFFTHNQDIEPQMAMKDPITCHVLDTLTGRPAAGIKAELSTDDIHGHPVWRAETNSDGRITNWNKTIDLSRSQATVEELFQTFADGNGTKATWRLKFFTGDYYGEGNTFWPEVNLAFSASYGEHYHVPLLLGPYSYTTYRGS
jgi:5-hydroxyisourate hydrolase